MRLAIVNKDKHDMLIVDNINLKEGLKNQQELTESWLGTATRRWDEILKLREAAEKREQALRESAADNLSLIAENNNLKNQVKRLTRKRNARGAFVKQN